MNSKITIETLVALRNGEHKAFETVFIAYYNKILSFIDGYIKSKADAEDLTENLFVNLWTNRESIDLSKSFNAYHLHINFTTFSINNMH